jgi:hypothetical protein
MGRRERRTSIGGQFAPRLIEMLESPAFRATSGDGSHEWRRMAEFGSSWDRFNSRMVSGAGASLISRAKSSRRIIASKLTRCAISNPSVPQ